MKRFFVVLACAGLLVAAVPAEAAKPRTLELSISNFRYCAAEMCSPLDVGYLRTSDGPVAGLDNPLAAIEVKRGTTVFWVYRDGFCDTVGCPGHNVIFENGTVQGVRKGFTPAGQGEKKIKAKINQKVGTTIRYFCSVNDHYQEGMTGVLQVIA